MIRAKTGVKVVLEVKVEVKVKVEVEVEVADFLTYKAKKHMSRAISITI